MAAKRYTVDTNILFYAIDSRDAKKHARALDLIHRGNSDCFRVILQTLGELCNSISKRQPALGQQAEQMVGLLQQIYPIVSAEFALSDNSWPKIIWPASRWKSWAFAP